MGASAVTAAIIVFHDVASLMPVEATAVAVVRAATTVPRLTASSVRSDLAADCLIAVLIIGRSVAAVTPAPRFIAAAARAVPDTALLPRLFTRGAAAATAQLMLPFTADAAPTATEIVRAPPALIPSTLLPAARLIAGAKRGAFFGLVGRGGVSYRGGSDTGAASRSGRSIGVAGVIGIPVSGPIVRVTIGRSTSVRRCR